jgi:hypothetical protein
MPIHPETVSAVLEIASKVTKGLNAMRERASASKDNDFKSEVGDLYDQFNSLREGLNRLTDENAKLKRSLAELENKEKTPTPEIRQVGLTNYYFVGDKEQPYCQPCYDVNHRLVPLSPQQSYAGGTGRMCSVCKNHFYETEAPRRGQIGTPWS